jgi:hypothetical protein
VPLVNPESPTWRELTLHSQELKFIPEEIELLVENKEENNTLKLS